MALPGEILAQVSSPLSKSRRTMFKSRTPNSGLLPTRHSGADATPCEQEV